jgi:hypothetical protein
MAIPNNESFTLQDVVDEINPSSDSLHQCFYDSWDRIPEFDSKYYPRYLVVGGNYMQSIYGCLLNYRNFGGAPDGIPIPVATAATDISYIYFTANWNSSVGAEYGYYIDVSLYSDFRSYIPGYANKYVGGYESQFVAGVFPGVTYYYRVRAYTYNGTSGNSNTISVTTPLWVPPVGFDDWYLPSISELGNIHSNTPWQNYGFNYGDYYWSSDYAPGYSPPKAWVMIFGAGETKYPEAYDAKVRAMRAFLDSEHNYEIGDTGPAGGYIVYKLEDYYKEIAPYDQSQEETYSAAITLCDNL